MQQTTTISSVQYNFQPSSDIYSQYGTEQMGIDAATDQLRQNMSSITVSEKENGINEMHWCSPCNQCTDSSCYAYTNPAEHQLMACDSCVQQCEVSHINSLRNGECWDNYERYGLNNNIEVMQPTLFYLLTSGCISNFGKDEKGSRFVQEEFAKSSPAVRQMMFDYLFERAGFDWFSNDPHGNFIIQKIAMEAFPGIEQARITEHVANKVVKMCSNRYGSRIMQRIFERFDFGYRVELLNKLSGSECFLAVDSCATHVMQKLFALFPPTKYSFIVIALTLSKENFKQVVQNKYGCRVIQSALEELEISACTTRYASSPNEFKAARRLLNKLLRRLTENCMEFTDHQFANYVMQHVITSEFHPEARDYIIKHAILSNVLTLSQEKFASHVVEKSLKHASPKVLHCLMSEIFDGYVKDDKGRDALDIMLFDQYGNYVVQTMINVSIDVHDDRREGDLIWLARLSERISRHESRLLRYSSGKKIIEKMKQGLSWKFAHFALNSLGKFRDVRNKTTALRMQILQNLENGEKETSTNMFLYLTTIALVFLFNGSKASLRRVSNVKSVKHESFPYIAELHIDWPDRKIVCTASLLSRSIIITAAHCIVDEKTKEELGKVKKVIFRRDYGRSYVTWVGGEANGVLSITELDEKDGILDYALLQLVKPLPICRVRNGRMFSIIKLPVKDIRACKWKILQPLKEFLDQCSLFGYGASEKDGPDGKLRKLTNISVWEVNGRLLIPMEDNAENIRQGRICGGDSGGPFVCMTDLGERIYGILSHSEPLLEFYPSSCYGEENAFLYDVMSDVRKMLPYIQDSLAKMNKTNELIEDYERCDS